MVIGRIVSAIELVTSQVIMPHDECWRDLFCYCSFQLICLKGSRWFRCVQALHENCGLEWYAEQVRNAGIRAARTVRDESPHCMSLYLHAAVGFSFLASRDGQSVLQAADAAGKAVARAAIEKQRSDTRAGDAVLGPYLWTGIRCLMPGAPGTLNQWANLVAEDHPKRRVYEEAPGETCGYGNVCICAGCVA